jgi:cobalt-zinc-cadmium efflux system protein
LSHDEHEHKHEHHRDHHDHCHDLENVNKKRLWPAFCLVASTMILEIVVGHITNSTALANDGYHMLADAISLGLALWAASFACRNKMAEINAALANGIILILMSFYLAYESYQRCLRPPEIGCTAVMIVASIGLLVNIIQLFILHGGDMENINMRAAFLHVVSDTLSSCGVIAGAIVIYYSPHLRIIDPIVGLAIALWICRYGISVIKKAQKARRQL